MKTNIISIATGNSKTYGEKDNIFYSAYKKDQFFNFLDISTLGLNGDEQVDKRYHGGEDKAIHIGSQKHFTLFKNLYKKDLDRLAIGCNIIVEDLDESDVCIGDIYTIDDIEIEVTQPRQPCWKIGAIFDKDISRYISKYHATGWYVRILNEGTIDINDEMILKQRVSNITIKELSEYLITPPKDQTIIDEILNIKALANSYKKDLQKALQKV
jgi:MOSC domain-containing protein YiiM